ncbi:MAG: diacylglycerol kinase (ATP) [Hyphomicrobiaceae bacterium]|jgi:diacylglycerol kinase (ATP)
MKGGAHSECAVRVGVIVNPHASGNRRCPDRAEKLRGIVGSHGVVRETKDLSDLDGALEEFRDSEIEVLALCGGDGSISHGLSRALSIWGPQQLPRVVVLRAGTINNISRSVGGPVRAEKGLEAMLAGLAAGREPTICRRAMIQVNGERSGFIIGAGLITHFLELYYEGARPGPFRAAFLLVVLGCSYLIGGKRIHSVVPTVAGRVENDDQVLPQRGFTLILASTVESIGLGVRPFYLAGRKPGFFHVLAGDPTAGQLLLRLWHFWRGFPPRLDPLYDGPARRLKVSFETPQRYTIDGELFGPDDELVLETGPTIEFLSPYLTEN